MQSKDFGPPYWTDILIISLSIKKSNYYSLKNKTPKISAVFTSFPGEFQHIHIYDSTYLWKQQLYYNGYDAKI